MGLTVVPPTATTAGGQQVFRASPILATNVVAFSHSTTPFIAAYPWSAGYGSKYANPASLITTGPGAGLSFAPNGSAVAFGNGSASTTALNAYVWSSGFGTRYQGTTVSSSLYQTAFSPDTAYVAAAGTSTPYVSVLPWTGSGFGTKVSDPGTTPAGASYSAVFAPSNDSIVVGHSTSPNVTAYPWSSSGFGTKYGDPGTPPASTGYAVAFTPTGSALAIGHSTTPFISVYPWSAGFGTRYNSPAVVPPNSGVGVSFSKAGDAVVVAATTTSPFVAAYQWSSSGFGTKYGDPGTAIGGSPAAGTGNKVAFAADDSAVAIGHATSPYISVYPWTYASGFGTKYSDPGTTAAGSATGISFGTLYT